MGYLFVFQIYLVVPGYSQHNVILLHDSGGDRSRTVEALPNLIDQLRAHGYTLVTMGQLAGLTPDEARRQLLHRLEQETQA